MPAAPAVDAIAVLVGFARALRAAGVATGPDRMQTFLGALAILGSELRSDVYWAGRLTLCGSQDDLERYDRVFAAYFAQRPHPGDRVRRIPAPVPQFRLGAADAALAARSGRRWRHGAAGGRSGELRGGPAPPRHGRVVRRRAGSTAVPACGVLAERGAAPHSAATGGPARRRRSAGAPYVSCCTVAGSRPGCATVPPPPSRAASYCCWT